MAVGGRGFCPRERRTRNRANEVLPCLWLGACAPLRWEVVVGLPCDSTPFLWCLPKETVSSRQRKALFLPWYLHHSRERYKSVDYTFLARLGAGLVLACGFLRVRRLLGQKSLPPAASSTPFLCSCAKKRGGAPKKRAFGCRHGRCWVPPASPTDSKPQHHHRLRQADLSARSTHQAPPQVGRGTSRPPTCSAHADGGAAKVKKAPFFGGSTPFLWASTKEMGSNGRTGHRPPPSVTAHTHKAKEKGEPPARVPPWTPSCAL